MESPIIQARRLLYLHNILKQKKESLLYRFFNVQLSNPNPRDWASQVLEDLVALDKTYEIEEIGNIIKEFFKKIVKTAVKKNIFLIY